MQVKSKNKIEVEVISPSSLLPNKAGAFFKSLFLGGIKEQFADRFGDKPYSLRNRKKYEMTYYVSFLFQVLSVAFALSFAVHLFSGLLPAALGGAKIYVAIGVGLLALLVLEIAKRIIITEAVDSHLKAQAIDSGFRINYANVALALILIALSIYSSVAGAKYFVELQTDKTVEITNTGQSQKDSLSKVYASELATVRAEIADIKHRNTYKGNTWIAGSDKKLLLAKEQTLAKFLQDKEQALQGTDKNVQNSITENQIGTADIALKMLCFSFGCEILTLICLWFLASYVFKSGLEISNQSGGQVAHHDHAESIVPNQKPIGFATALQSRKISGRQGGAVFAKHKKQNPIGFKFGNANRNTQTVNTENVNTENVNTQTVGNGNRVCKHCSKVYTYGHHRQVYCKDDCRILAWEKRTGRKFKKGKKAK